MLAVAISFPDEDIPKARLALLLEHFSELSDDRESWRVMYPLREALLLATCATICSCDDFDDIVLWGEHHLDFLRRFSPFHFGVPCARWVHTLLNRVDPVLFARCYQDWIAALWPGRHDLIAIPGSSPGTGKTARRSGDKRKGLKALHTLSAYASNARLTLAQIGVPEKTNEIAAIPELIQHLAEAGQLEGALVTIDAMGCQAGIADKIVACGADCVLALKGNQPNLEAEVEAYFADAPAAQLARFGPIVEKGHGRIETRQYAVSGEVGWIVSGRSYPGAPRFTNITSLVKVQARVEHADRCSFETRYFISSAAPDAARLAGAVRAHWGVESMHWLLDVEFKDDLSRYRAGHGAKNMAAVRRFALSLVRADKSKGSVKSRRKAAGWSPDFLLKILQIKPS